MPCSTCNNCLPVNYVYNTTPCVSTTSTLSVTADASTVMYSGPNLVAIGVEPNTNLQEALEAINTAVGDITGIDWSSFDYFCLDDVTPITTAQGFVETISDYVCTLNTDFITFSGITYVAGIADLQEQIDAINEPELVSCESVGVIESDNIIAILTKLISAQCATSVIINPDSANWNNDYFTTDPLPTTITEAFDVVIAQLVNLFLISEGIQPLPTFDNTTSCLAAPLTATDTLSSTVLKIRDYLCELPTFDINNITWTDCIANPNPSGGPDIESAIQTLVSFLDTTYTKRVVTWDPTYFDVTFNVPDNPCSGYNVTLQSESGFTDRLVSLDGSDLSPNYLLDKMTEGTNITFDTSTAPGTVIINCDSLDEKVKANSGDASAGYLIDKIDGQIDSTGAISLVEAYNATSDKVDLTPVIDYSVLAENVLAAIASSTSLSTTFCGLSCGCQPCPEGEARTVSGVIEFVTGSDDMPFSVQFSQLSPTLDFYNSGVVAGESGLTISTGAYTVTSSSVPVTGVVTVNNLDSTDPLPYNIYVVDENDDPVVGSTTQTGSIPLEDSLTINPFTYGSVTNMIVHIELGDALTTTTSTTTTTTTTPAP